MMTIDEQIAMILAGKERRRREREEKTVQVQHPQCEGCSRPVWECECELGGEG